MVEVSSPQTLPALLNVVELLRSALELLAAKPSPPEDHPPCTWHSVGIIQSHSRAMCKPAAHVHEHGPEPRRLKRGA